ncbi:MAG: dihydrolipoyl dehydrogenase [Acidimicrobiia bacterium]|nr:dihydrolipoyl dehydrogenase [Acidimicrobiia bacterium]
MTNHDVVIIGGGPGGEAAALYGASAGLDVGLVEMHKVGGTCLHVGCIPAKELLETASVYRTISEAAAFGVTAGEPSVDFTVAQARKQAVVDRLHKGLSGLLKGRDVTMYDGVGTLHANRTVRVSGGESGDVEITGTSVVIATGSTPRTIPGFEVDGHYVVTSDEVLSLDHIPARVAVIGGGAIGCEFASMLSDLGSEVMVFEALPRILVGADEDVGKVVERSFKKRGISVRAGVSVSAHVPGTTGTAVQFGDGESIEVDKVIVSVGRRPRSADLGLDGTAVVVDGRGFVEVDEYCQTGEPGVYAVGDVIDTAQLAHVAFAEGVLVIQHLLGENPVPVDYDNVPWAIYCHPEVAFSGLTEEAAAAAGYEVVVSKHRYAGNGRALIIGQTEGLVKVVAEKRPDGTGGRILGVHLAGPWVTEQLGQGYLAVNWEATVDEISQFIQPHPTLSELFGESVMAMTGRSIHG